MIFFNISYTDTSVVTKVVHNKREPFQQIFDLLKHLIEICKTLSSSVVLYNNNHSNKKNNLHGPSAFLLFDSIFGNQFDCIVGKLKQS